jgi:CRISPR-associated endonuclease/helicase Cas3
VSAAYRRLLSHPDKPLSQHIDEVREAARAILCTHSPDIERERLIEEIVSLHDLGKANTAFQDYIRDTSGYRGGRNNKAHTPVGFTATLLLGERLGRDPFWTLCAAAAVLGHHTGFPDSHRLTDQYLLGDEWKEIIDEQATNIPAEKISELTGFSLTEILSDPNLRYNAFFVVDKILEAVKKNASNDLPGAVADRLRMQFAFSVLLEADKAFLALSSRGRESYREVRNMPLSPEMVEEHMRGSEPSEMNTLRTAARREALGTLLEDPYRRLWTLALPTGLGKTLTAASLAMSLRDAGEATGPKRCIIVLPFLSIIDQTAKVYDELLDMPQTSTLMQSHSLSERTYDDTEERDAEFFLDTWDSEIIVTTFDQFLLSLLGTRARHQMRFHNLADSIIVFDEVQALPTQLWDIVKHSLTQLTEHLNSTAILMSATQPGFLEEAKSLIRDPKNYYDTFRRYRLVLKHRQPMLLDEFIESVLGRREELEEERVLITLNTRASARAVRDALAEAWSTPVYFLTADVTPKDRLAAIAEIKGSDDEPCLVISTQVIEAGVDVDMTLVMRDFAPLDSLVQIAGRCNRNGCWQRKAVEIYHLKNAAGRSFAEMVYTVGKGSPDLRLEETRRVLTAYEIVPEEDVLGICEEYFGRLRDGKDLGEKHTRNWATLDKEQPNIRALLRGERDTQVQLIVAERDENYLRGDIEDALAIEERWDRRRALRKLAGRIARVSVSVRVRGEWRPEEVANPLGYYDSNKPLDHPWWIVRPGNYDSERGLRLDGDPFL